MNADARVHDELADMLNYPDSIVMTPWKERLVLHLYWYHQSGGRLRKALEESTYT